MSTANQGPEAPRGVATSDLLDMVLAVMPDAAVVVDADAVVVALNGPAEALFNYRSADLVGRRIELLIPERFRHKHVVDRATYLAAPRMRAMGVGLELAGRRRDGTEFPVDVNLAPVRGGDQPLVLAAIRDVSERNAATMALAQLAAIVQSSFDAIVGMTLDGQITSWNPGAARLFGYHQDEIVGGHISRLTPPDGSPELEELLAVVMGGRSVSLRDTRWVTKSTSVLDVAISVSPTRGPGGDLTGCSIIARDITERKRSEAELRRQERWQAATAEIRLAMLSNLPGVAVFDVICRRVRELLSADASAIVLALPEGLRVVGAAGSTAALVGQILAELPAVLAPALVGDPVRTVTAAGVGSAGGAVLPIIAPGSEGDGDRVAPFGGGPLLAVPIRSDRSNGVLVAVRPAGRRRFSPGEVGLVEGFGAAAALAIELSRARADRDQLLVVADRERIARDLHDLVIQRLFGTGMSLQRVVSLIGDEEVAARVSGAIDSIDSTIHEIRSAIFALQPPVASEGRLRSEILHLAEGEREQLGFRPSVTFAGPIDIEVSDDLGGEVLAVIREALSNVARHARAGRALVEVRADGDLVVAVTDDGIGMATSSGRGNGLDNLAARARRRGGTLTVTRGDGGGTRLSWQVPLAD